MIYRVVGRDSSVRIPTRSGVDGPGVKCRWGGGRDFPHPSKRTLFSNQPPIQWIPGLSRWQSDRSVAL